MSDLSTPADVLKTHRDGATLMVEINGGPRQEFGETVARALEVLVAEVDQDPDIHAVIFTSAHPTRFISHADVTWLQEGGVKLKARLAAGASAPPPDPDTFGLDRLHGLFLKMNSASAVFIAALEGPALGLGAEFSWACDLRVMADADAFIGQPEVLLAIMPGGGGTQRLTRLVGSHRSLVAILEGKPFTPQQALAIGAVDAVAPRGQVVAEAKALAAHFGKRHKASIGAIKRAVYLGGSLPLPDALQLETREFMGLDMAPEGQRRMLAYEADTETQGDLPLYVGDGYASALASGST
ncbi:enoyl-CoA hydratase/isomerase family protein [Brevundimonas sp.]|uniref:enoyl-CoA hydratase/isomerase family protein n=1 Tax=Brevundimonas sp. TaxID=1871086 RepID=UPI002FD884B2